VLFVLELVIIQLVFTFLSFLQHIYAVFAAYFYCIIFVIWLTLIQNVMQCYIEVMFGWKVEKFGIMSCATDDCARFLYLLVDDKSVCVLINTSYKSVKMLLKLLM